ncbi:MAG: LuxR C-terminal-related transcriptional regulator [Burkholderiales bacterium]
MAGANSAEPPRASLLASKLTPPLATPFEIARTEICDKIFNAGASRLVLLRAPAGFGKTTVMLQVRQRFDEAGLPTAWLRLDRSDNDVVRFLATLAAALGPLVPGLGGSAVPAGRGPDDLAFALIDRVAAHPAPFALFLDDFEALQNPSVIGLVNELIEQLPRGAQLLVGSRGVPALSLGRLRARGRLLEIEPTQLRFSEDETSGFLLGCRGLALEPQDVRHLHRSTEGWAAALWLASVSLEHREQPGRFIASFSGSNAAVVDYLVEDVLAHQSEEVRGFLLRTSILSDLNASLCNVVCARQDSADLLLQLEKAHLFLMPLQADRSGFRYHGMFAEFLRAQLQRQHPDEVPRLHRAASEWFLVQGRPVPAIEHALATGDIAYALPLLGAHAEGLLDQGRVGLLSRWLDPLLSAGQLGAHPMLQVVHAWAVCFSRGPRAAAPLLDRLETLADDDAQVRAHRLVMRLFLTAMVDRNEETGPLAAALVEGLPSNAAFVCGFLEIMLANLAMIAGRYHDALRFADAARSRQLEHGSSFNFALSEAAEGAVDLTQGRLRKALARLRLAVSAGAADASRATNGNAMVGVLLAEALYEADHCDQAERLLAVYIPLIRRVSIPDQLISAHIVMARIALGHGDGDRALQMLTELEHLGHRDGLPRVVASARLERVRILLVEDRLQQARAEIDRCGTKALWARVASLSLRANEVETHDLAMARWSVSCGHAAAVIPSLRRDLDAAERAQRERRALTLRLLLAQALYRDEQRNKAMRVLAKAVSFAAVEGYVRAFLDEGQLLKMMLRELRNSPAVLQEGAGGAAPLAFIDRLLRDQPARPQQADAAAPSMHSGPTATSDLLTRKEIQVLRLAAEGLSNDELADRLFVAETTVRTHLRNINVKLDVRNRMEAIAVARRAGLIS